MRSRGRSWAASFAARVSARSRTAKLRYLLDRLGPDDTVLLVGVAAGAGVATRNAIETALARGRTAVALCYEQPATPPISGVPTVRGDARAMPFADGAFDYVVSNAVVEHLGGVEGARRLLAESARVSRRGYVHTTPNRWFPVETHTLLPLLHWGPRRWQTRVFARFGYRFPPSGYWLFSPRTLAAVHPGTAVVRLGRSPMAMTLLVTGPGDGRDAG